MAGRSASHRAGLGPPPKGGAERTRDRLRRETRARVYQAALDIFRRDGVDEARIEDIVRRAGTSRGTFYFHFPTKDDVLAELLQESERRVAAAVEAVPSEAGIAEVFDRVGQAIAEDWRGDEAILPSVAVVALRVSAATLAEGMGQTVRRSLGHRAADAAQRGELRPEIPPATLADLFLMNQFSMMLAWCAQRRSRAGRLAPSLELALRGAASLFLEGARAPRLPEAPAPAVRGRVRARVRKKRQR
jgi:AcrR family transcriptional regulator